MSTEIKKFEIGDIAYILDENYNFFENKVYRIEFTDWKYHYYTHDVDFYYEDIGVWVFTAEVYSKFGL